MNMVPQAYPLWATVLLAEQSDAWVGPVVGWAPAGDDGAWSPMIALGHCAIQPRAIDSVSYTTVEPDEESQRLSSEAMRIVRDRR